MSTRRTHGAIAASLLPTTPGFLRLQAGRRGDAGGSGSGAVPFPSASWLVRSRSCRRGSRAAASAAGQTVGVMAANEPAMVAALYAIWGLGAAAVPIGVALDRRRGGTPAGPRAGRACSLTDAPAPTSRATAAASAGALAVVVERRPAAAPARPPPPPAARGIAPRSPRARRPSPRSPTRRARPARRRASCCRTRNLLWAALACARARGDDADGVGACISPLTPRAGLRLASPLPDPHRRHAPCCSRSSTSPPCSTPSSASASPTCRSSAAWSFDVVARATSRTAVRRSVRKVSVGGAPTPMASKRALRDAVRRRRDHRGVRPDRIDRRRDRWRAARSVFDREGTVGRQNPHVDVAVRRARRPPRRYRRGGRDRHRRPDGHGAATTATPPPPPPRVRDGWLHTGDLRPARPPTATSSSPAA